VALEIVRSQAARLDLYDIWQFIAEDNEAAADRLIDRIDAVFRMLADNPQGGRARPELKIGIRSFPVGAYIVFYRILADTLVELRVLNSYRDIDGSDMEGSPDA